MPENQTIETIKESVERLSTQLLQKKYNLKKAKELREDILISQDGYKKINIDYKDARLKKDIFKINLEKENPTYKATVDKVKDASLELKVVEDAISQQLSDYVAQKGEFAIPKTNGEKVSFRIKCLFSARQLKLFTE